MSERRNALGLLLLRTVPSIVLAWQHGWPKASTFSERIADFPDPLHVGQAASLVLTIFGELVCPIAVALGVFTRLAAIPPLVTMLVAALVVHAGDPFARRELALVYAVAFVAIALLGGGPWSADARWRKK